LRLFGLKLLGQYIDDVLARKRLSVVRVHGLGGESGSEQAYRTELASITLIIIILHCSDEA
jgi:hypothetical protein